MYRASSIDPDPDNSIHLEVDVVHPTDQGYTRPGEEVVFHFSTDTVEMVSYVLFEILRKYTQVGPA